MKAASIVLLATVLFTLGTKAQVIDNTPRTNGLLDKKHVPNRAPVPYAQLREADLMYEKWIWRTIDVREKMNHSFYYPFERTNNRVNLITIVLDAIKEGSITAYDAGKDDEFLVPLTKEAVALIGAGMDTTQAPSLENPDSLVTIISERKLDPRNVLEWQLKEIWFFDKQKSIMDVRIIGMCPMLYVYDKNGEFKGKMAMFWIYFPQARAVFAKNDVFNRFNDSERRTWDDIFWKRMFSSYITKETNPFDRRIADYKIGMDALIEADGIKNNLMNIEHDLWDF